jgi:hypothetical protein
MTRLPGFHDIVSILILALREEQLVVRLACQLAHSYLRDFFHTVRAPPLP